MTVGVMVGVDGAVVTVGVGVSVGVMVGLGVGVGSVVHTNNELDNKNIFPPLVPVGPLDPVGNSV